MNCFNHSNIVAVGICNDCKTGLCLTCASKYTIHICSRCNIRRAKREKSKILNELILTFFAGLIFVAFSIVTPTNEDEIHGTKWFLIRTIATLILFYGGASIVSGWKALNSFTSQFFLFLPIVGWVIYFFVKVLSAASIGWIMLPLRCAKNFKRLHQLKNIAQ